MVATAVVSASTTLDAVTLVALDVALRQELDGQRRQVVELETAAADLTGSNDPDSVLARDMAERSMNVALDVVAEIELALERISTATYGRCEVCDGAIAGARLEALPYARHCVSCPPPPPLPRQASARA